jgi:hypothetical protein
MSGRLVSDRTTPPVARPAEDQCRTADAAETKKKLLLLTKLWIFFLCFENK